MDDPVDRPDRYQDADLIALSMGRISASRLTPDSIHAFRASLDRVRAKTGDNRYYRAWDAIISAGGVAIADALTDTSERGQTLRSVISFEAFITPRERTEIVRTYRPIRGPRAVT